MNDRLNAPLEPRDDGTLQHDPLYQEPSEGIAIESPEADHASTVAEIGATRLKTAS